MADWSNLPEAILYMIAVRLFSVIELIRFRSICTSWRSSVSGNNNPLPSRPLIHLNRFPGLCLAQWFGHMNIFLSGAAFYRVTLSSFPSQGWLIKSDEMDINSRRFRLLEPLSRLPMRHSCKGIDLLEFTVSEIREAYELQDWHTGSATFPGFKRVVLVKGKEGEAHHNCILGIGFYGEIEHWDGNNWRELREMNLKNVQFSDIIVHKGLTYALDERGIVWWISSDLEMFRYGPPVDDDIVNSDRGDQSFVECCGELYIVERLLEADSITVGFKVYKFDEELGKMIEVKSLSEYAFVMATDTCFSVLAHEFYGCLQNSIYFTDDQREIKVFKLDNGSGSSITSMSEFSMSCFQIFVPGFL